MRHRATERPTPVTAICGWMLIWVDGISLRRKALNTNAPSAVPFCTITI